MLAEDDEHSERSSTSKATENVENFQELIPSEQSLSLQTPLGSQQTEEAYCVL
jgi:hypothetical protein